RMLQRYPELTKKVTLLVSIVGFAHKDDFKFTRPRYMTYIAGSKILTYRPFAFLFYHITLNPWLLKKFYGRTHNAKKKFALAADDPLEIQKINDAEVKLWRENDVRTWGYTTNEFLKLDNCKVKVDMPVWHVGTKDDSYFDAHLVEQHMRIIFNGFEYGEFQMAAHAPSVMAEEKDAAGLVPAKLRRRLSRLR
ncbi:MAG TPA: hypothetical protein VK534_01590, partial [Methylomirabilota bacterium]|nr:hypothetical protein [Methylomirabilota bacterium]